MARTSAMAGGVDGVGIDRRAQRRQFALGGRHQHLGGKGGIVLRAGQHRPSRRYSRGRRWPATSSMISAASFWPASQRLKASLSLPIRMARSRRVLWVCEDGGRGKAAAQRQQRRFGHIDEDETLLGLGQFQHPGLGPGFILAFQGQRQGVSALAHQARCAPECAWAFCWAGRAWARRLCDRSSV